MARCLIVGCGCHGVGLAAELIGRDHVVRGTSRDPQRLEAIRAAGAEAVLADPDRIATLVPALDHASVIVLLLGSATGPADKLEALHGPRLEMLLTKVLDTTVRGIVYETVGTVDSVLLERGAEQIRNVCEGSRIGHALLDVPRGDPNWSSEAVARVETTLTG